MPAAQLYDVFQDGFLVKISYLDEAQNQILLRFPDGQSKLCDNDVDKLANAVYQLEIRPDQVSFLDYRADLALGVGGGLPSNFYPRLHGLWRQRTSH